MDQPTIEEISNKLIDVIYGKCSREKVGEWALNYISNDDAFDVVDFEAWHYLLGISGIDLMIVQDEYLYSVEDIMDWVEEYDETRKNYFNKES